MHRLSSGVENFSYNSQSALCSVNNLLNIETANWSTLKFSELEGQRLDANCTRLKGNSEFIDGYIEFFNITDQFSIVIADHKIVQDVVLHFSPDNFIRFAYLIDGHVDIQYKNGVQISTSPLNAQISIDCEHSGSSHQYQAQTRQQGIFIFIAPQALKEEVLLYGDQLSKDLSDIFCRKRLVQSLNVPFYSDMRKIVTDILLQRNRPFRQGYLKAKASELLCTHLHHLQEQTALQHNECSASLTAKDIRKLTEVREIIRGNMMIGISLPKLAKQVGLNRNRLSYGFHQLFGETIADYTMKLRIEFTKKFLCRKKGTVKELALLLGYKHPSNLSTMIKNQTGLTAKQLKKQLLSEMGA